MHHKAVVSKVKSTTTHPSPAGCGVPRPMRDKALVVTFVGIPGLGKSAVCDRLVEYLSGDQVAVQHFMSDKVAKAARRAYWGDVAKRSVSETGKANVVLADKNLLEAPPGACAESCAESLSFLFSRRHARGQGRSHRAAGCALAHALSLETSHQHLVSSVLCSCPKMSTAIYLLPGTC
jgi:hypothetical protein